MTDFPARASAVIIGAGIVGNSLAHHLARPGWRDLVLVDKGPMPNLACGISGAIQHIAGCAGARHIIASTPTPPPPSWPALTTPSSVTCTRWWPPWSRPCAPAERATRPWS
jgi:glycine/D-amino acid oxidase-like deaminating enzyme